MASPALVVKVIFLLTIEERIMFEVRIRAEEDSHNICPESIDFQVYETYQDIPMVAIIVDGRTLVFKKKDIQAILNLI